MPKQVRLPGGEKNKKTGVDWTKLELERVLELYIQLGGKTIHENNPAILDLAEKLGRTVRSVENQLLGFKKVATGEVGRTNYNRLIPVIWKERFKKSRNERTGMHFKVSSALKDIIGRDLITDDHMAVFELVKNSFDAHATRVDIYFKDIYTKTPKIIIKDNGKGMDKLDIQNKWLFLGYSAKREGLEDDDYDYRDNISKRQVYAGAKGIGRFSCDRLGSRLKLETTKKGKNSKTYELEIDWSEFESNSKKEFTEINIDYKVKKKTSYGLSHGTVIEITDLRSVWDRKKIIKLKDSLTKLINPSRGKGEHTFKIVIHSDEEKAEDKSKENREKVNGEIKNFIFETLGLKTTKIISSISEDGKHVTTELVDGGSLIYKIVEKNSYELLDSIDCTIFYLNQAAKRIFIDKMGVSSSNYGHIFLYKNGFRIYPFGEPGEDPLKIDVRKTQGTRRYLGTREVIGQIEIFSDSDQFRETSSRGDGLIKTDTYYQLEDYFRAILRRLEKYVVDVQKWGLSIEDDNNKEVKGRITRLLANLTGSDSILEFQYADNILELLDGTQSSANKVVKNLKKLAILNNDDKLLAEVERANKKLFEIQEAREQAEMAAEAERKNAAAAQKELKQKETENLFLKSLKSQDLDEVVSFMHSIGISASSIDNYLSSTYQKINRNIEINQTELARIIEVVSFENRKILSISRFATKANFKLFAEERSVNLVEFIKEYIQNVIAPLRKGSIDISLKDNTDRPIKKNIKPIEISILIDNFVSNAIRAKSKRLEVRFESSNSFLELILTDDGMGVPDELKEKIFDFGYTTTSGSGLGLYHVKQILINIDASISVNTKLSKGVQFIIKFK